jgi:two-component system, OmpR family, KDP operon response regulator KdpE
MSARPVVLLCDEESQTVRALRLVLGHAGFDVEATSTAEQALKYAALHTPDAAVIELALPDADGVELCRRLRDWSAMPLIVLSGLGDEEQKVRAFEAGADDYVTKPFGPRELVARLRAILRRAEGHRDPPVVEFDGLEIDLAAGLVRREGRDVHLTPIEFKLLRILVRNRGRTLTYQTLLQQIWGRAYVEDRQTLRAHIANLRHKIDPGEGEQPIRTYHGVGYRFADSARARGEAPPSPMVRPVGPDERGFLPPRAAALARLAQ